MRASALQAPVTAPRSHGSRQSVLVLNRLYMAVHVVNVRRAICLLFRELAEVIHIEAGRYVNYDFVSWQEISQLKLEFEE